MNKTIHTLLAVVISAFAFNAWGNNTEQDTTAIRSYTLDEITIICNPKVESKIFEMPSSITLLGEHTMQQYNITSVKDLTTIAGNVYIPDYGSNLITSAHIRGIGSRINSPAVGMSVNNIPYLDKSAYIWTCLMWHASRYCEALKAHCTVATQWPVLSTSTLTRPSTSKALAYK